MQDAGSTALFEELLGIADAKNCAKGSAAGCVLTLLNVVPIKKLLALKALGNLADAFKLTDDVPWNAFCSFSADTEVLLADGSSKPISEIEIGDQVAATDPETGKEGPRHVTHIWVHDDDLVLLDIDGAILKTTEDHPFWNETDGQWQRADKLDKGDQVLVANGSSVTVNGIMPGPGTKNVAAYNLTVAEIHTYYILAGSAPVLVHNSDACDVYHGTDLDSANNIVRNGLDVNAARRLGGGDVFWVTTNRSDAELFAAVNPSSSETWGVVGVRINGGLEAGIRSGVVEPVKGFPGAYKVVDWDGLNDMATFELVSSG